MYLIQKALLGIEPRLRGLIYRWWIILNGGKCGKRLHVHRGVWFKHPPHAGIRFGEDVCLGRGVVVDVPKGARLQMGNRVAFTGYTYISSAQEVVFEDDILVGEYSSVRDANHASSLSSTIKSQPMDPKPIHVESDVWIGRGVTILRGSTVKTGCIVGANALVNDCLEPLGVYVGQPAKRIAERWQSATERV